jgi:hypothetical protein
VGPQGEPAKGVRAHLPGDVPNAWYSIQTQKFYYKKYLISKTTSTQLCQGESTRASSR